MTFICDLIQSSVIAAGSDSIPIFLNEDTETADGEEGQVYPCFSAWMCSVVMDL